MKKIFMMLLITLVVIGMTSDVFVYATKLLFGDPQSHIIQKGEYFSKIAQHYYGNADYWRELALINRAPNSDLVFPGEEIIIPRLEVLKQIRRTNHLSEVNMFVRGEEDILARLSQKDDQQFAAIETQEEQSVEPVAEVTEPEEVITQEVEPVAEPQQSSLTFILLVIGIVFIVALASFLLIRRKKKAEQYAIMDDIEDAEENEPDYQEYIEKKKEKEKAKEIVLN